MDKLEKEIKKTLDKRAITPSSEAWIKIESQLEPAPQEARGTVLWYGMAAAAAVLLITSSIFIFNNESGQPVIEVVENEAQKTNQDTEAIDVPPSKLQPIVEVQDVQKVPVIGKPPEKALLMPVPETAEVLVEQRQSIIVEDKTTIAQSRMTQKVQEIVQQVIDLESNDIAVTEAEVDALLFQAQKELLVEDVLNDNGKVDAMALLNEVEDELDRTFRGQLFEKLKDNYFKVRMAMADRNK